MKLLSDIVVLLAVGWLSLGALQAQAPNTLTKEEIAAGWRLLFDGSTLNGWEARGNPATAPAPTCGVADHAIYCDGDNKGWLASNEAFSDFQLMVEIRLAEKGNSGVYLRSQKTAKGPGPAQTGYELQIWDFGPDTPGSKTGDLYGAIESERTRFLADQWNSFDIRAEGDHFIVVMNGKKITDGHDSKHASGVIGLQYNTGAGKVEFRNIKILPMKH
jgi:hypothetical protein